MAKLDPWGSTLVYSTFLGGSDSEWASDIAVDRPGNVYVAGHAGNSPDFPTSNPFQPNPLGGQDAFVTKVARAVYVVNANDDVHDGTCDATHCSLREAIATANAIGEATIVFNIPGPGPHRIRPSSPLPYLTVPVIIDGYTQPGSSPNTNPPHQGSNAVLMIELEGTNAGTNVDGLVLTGGGSTVRGLVVNRFDGNGIVIANSSGSVVEGNYIGTDNAGTAALGNGGDGVLIFEAAYNTVGGTSPGSRNVISGNSFSGIEIRGSNSTSNKVQGNFIGTDVSGTADLDNEKKKQPGVFINGAPNNVIGGTVAGAGNIIAYNSTDGVVVDGSGTGNAISSNSIFANASLGIDLNDDGNTLNDLFDADSGANNLQNSPAVFRAEIDIDGNLIVEYAVDTNDSRSLYPIRV